MFGAIAPRYDLLNRLLSVGRDTYWRKRTIKEIAKLEQGRILDVATGTGDMAFLLAAATPDKVSIVGMDFCREMLVKARNKAQINRKIDFLAAPCEMIPFKDCSFDALTIAFGVRNFDERANGLLEMYRVLKPEGKLVILEFSVPHNLIVRAFYYLYMRWVLPAMGGLLSRFSAYQYLPESVYQFPSREEFLENLADIGFIELSHKDLTFGIVTIYSGKK